MIDNEKRLETVSRLLERALDQACEAEARGEAEEAEKHFKRALKADSILSKARQEK